MRDMAQLRLQDEVTRLEGSLTGDTAAAVSARPAATTLLPPYVVPDGPTLCDHLNVVRLLAASSRFIVIIPIDGIQYAMYWFQFLFRSDRRFIIGRHRHLCIRRCCTVASVRPSVSLGPVSSELKLVETSYLTEIFSHCMGVLTSEE